MDECPLAVSERLLSFALCRRETDRFDQLSDQRTHRGGDHPLQAMRLRRGLHLQRRERANAPSNHTRAPLNRLGGANETRGPDAVSVCYGGGDLLDLGHQSCFQRSVSRACLIDRSLRLRTATPRLLMRARGGSSRLISSRGVCPLQPSSVKKPGRGHLHLSLSPLKCPSAVIHDVFDVLSIELGKRESGGWRLDGHRPPHIGGPAAASASHRFR